MSEPGEEEGSRKEPSNAKLLEKMEELSEDIQKFTVGDYIRFIKSPRKMILFNFLAGLVRGLGIAVGITFLGAIFLLVLIRMAEANIPVIGEFLARLIQVIQTHL